jgi:hypothetical protein
MPGLYTLMAVAKATDSATGNSSQVVNSGLHLHIPGVFKIDFNILLPFMAMSVSWPPSCDVLCGELQVSPSQQYHGH